MPILIGFLVALAVCTFTLLVGFTRDRAFYPTVLIVVASYYVLFAVMGESTSAILVETLIMAGFTAVAVMGFKATPWLIVAGLAGHGLIDCFHGHVVTNPGVPDYWPAFCASYDVTAAAFLAWLILRRNSPATLGAQSP